MTFDIAKVRIGDKVLVEVEVIGLARQGQPSPSHLLLTSNQLVEEVDGRFGWWALKTTVKALVRREIKVGSTVQHLKREKHLDPDLASFEVKAIGDDKLFLQAPDGHCFCANAKDFEVIFSDQKVAAKKMVWGL